MTQTERNNIDNALTNNNVKHVLRQETDSGGNTVYRLYTLVPDRIIPDVAAYGNIYGVTITP